MVETREGSHLLGHHGRGEIALDRQGQRGELLVADDPPELALGLEHPGGGPAKGHLARLPALGVAGGAPHARDHRLDRVGRGERACERAADPEAGEGERLGHPLTQGGRRAGVAVRELGRELLQAPEGPVVVALVPRRAKLAEHERPVALGQVIEDVGLLVADASARPARARRARRARPFAGPWSRRARRARLGSCPGHARPGRPGGPPPRWRSRSIPPTARAGSSPRPR